MNINNLLNHYPVLLPDFENHKILIKTAGFWTGAKLFFDGEPVPRAGKKGQYVLQDQEGKEVRLRIRFENIFNPVPKVMSDDKYIYLTEPVKWVQWVWCGFPLIYFLITMLLGGVLGSLGFLINSQIFGIRARKIYKYFLSGVVSVVMLILYLLLADIFIQNTRGFHFRKPFAFASKEGNFFIMAPDTLREYNWNCDIEEDIINVREYSAEKDGIDYLVGYLDYTEKYYNSASLLKILDYGETPTLSEINGKIVSGSLLSLNGYPGREYTYLGLNQNGEEEITRVRIYIINNRMYQLITSAVNNEENNKKIDEFFRSFKILNTAPKINKPAPSYHEEVIS